MLLAIVAVGIGVAIGVVTPPARGRRYAQSAVRGPWVLIAGVALSAAGMRIDNGFGFAMLLAGYAVIIGGLVANVHVPGMALLLVGLSMNAAVTALNGGMPVSPDALVTADVLTPAEVPGATLAGHRHVETDDDKMSILGDHVPLPAVHQVVSYGDIVLAVGLVDAVANLTRRQRTAGRLVAQSASTSASPDHD